MNIISHVSPQGFDSPRAGSLARYSPTPLTRAHEAMTTRTRWAYVMFAHILSYGGRSAPAVPQAA